MLGIDQRLLTPSTMKWVKLGWLTGLAGIPLTIFIYYLLGITLDAALEGDNLLRLWVWPLALLVLLKAALAWAYRTTQFRASGEAKMNVRDRIYNQVIKLGPGLLGKRRTGEISFTASEGVEYLDYYFGVYGVQVWVAMVIPVLICATIFWIDWVVGLWMLAGVFLTPLFVGISALGFRKVAAQNEEIHNQNTAHYLDSIQGMSTLKMFNQGHRRGKLMEALNEKQRIYTMKLLLVAQLQLGAIEFGFALFSTAVAFAASIYRLSSGFMTPGECVAVVLMSVEFSRTLLLVVEFFFAGAQGREVALNIVEFLNEKSPVGVSPKARQGRTSGKAIGIEMRDLSYTYPGAESPAIRNLSFKLEPNQTTALIGRSGSGKTTVTNLMLRTLDPQSGQIMFDGVPEEELTLDWIREQIALVPQDPFLFYGTIADNLRMAKKDATDEELMTALKGAELYDFVHSTPAGLDTKVGDQGMALSGGQAQRLAIARALLKDAPIVILDEPTSQIDVETETLLHRALDRLSENKTVLLIAHRLSTIEQADCILVMERGELVESGSREELLAEGGIYAGMIKTKHQIEQQAMRPAAAV